LLVALLALFPLTASASPYDRPHGGFFLRLHQATLVSDDIPDRFIEPYTGFGLGVYAGIPLNEFFGLQAEATFSRRGGRFVVEQVVVDTYSFDYVENTYRFDYFELASLLRFDFPVSTAALVYLEGGIALALVLDAEEETIIRHSSGYESNRRYVSDYLESPEPCALLGGGLAFPVGQMGFQVRLRYQWGLLDPLQEFPFEVRTRNLAIQFGMA